MKTFLGAALVAAASATDLKVAWSDCGGSSTHTKITGFTPSTLALGKKTTMTGTGTLDEDVPAATFDLELKTVVGTVSCKGDASQTKTCKLPLGTGSITFDAMAFPVKKGTTEVNVDITLSSLIPPALAATTTKVTSSASNGGELFCMQIKTSKADDVHPDRMDMIKDHGLPVTLPPQLRRCCTGSCEHRYCMMGQSELPPVTPVCDCNCCTQQVAEVTPAVLASDLKVAWSDCGGSSTHTKITGFTPSTLSLGRKTTMSGTGTLDEDVSAATFDLELKTVVGTVSCKGDASQTKTCKLPLGTGSITFDAMAFPVKKGTTDVNVDITLSSLIPPALAATTTKVTSTASNGEELFCMQIKTSKADDVHLVVV